MAHKAGLPDAREHRLVAAVHAVEVSDGDDAASRKVNGAKGILDDLQADGS